MAMTDQQGTVTLRPGKAGDGAAIKAMLDQMAADMGQAGEVDSVAEDFERHGFGGEGDFHMILAEKEGAPVGMGIWFLTFSTWRGERGVYLQDLYVAKAVRGTGLAQRLIAEVAREGAALGATHLRLSVDHDNKGAMALYERCGLAMKGEENIYQIAEGAFAELAK